MDSINYNMMIRDEENFISAYTLPTHLIYQLDTKYFSIYVTVNISIHMLSTQCRPSH